ncbi:MAG TPA: carboxypeptidase regulatory-like domain-containing protein, partial [Candidatus Dormibacteraeota bacterium]|nr:carboxypeptidase regulatory-like domain-containing protein [Candidatus Dormibacteraeota bacterium]
VALALVVAGCAKKASQPAEQPAAAPAAPAATVNPATAGEITGTVKFVGTPPKMPIIRMGADPGCVTDNKGAMVHGEQVVVGKDGALANVVVYIKSGLGNYQYTTPTTAATLDQKGCMYEPHVVTLMTNQPFNVINSDSFTHNIHVMPKDNPAWNEAQPAGAAPIVKTFPHAEMAIPVRCNIHPWMQSYICVFDNPYFATTGDDGTFTIKNVPPGTYTIAAWQEKYGTQDQQVTVGTSQTKTVTFSFKAQ